MKYLQYTFVVVFLLAANLGFVYFAFPDSIPGRLLSALLHEEDKDGFRVSNSPVYRTFQCDNALPKFTLDEYANPTDEQLSSFCSCLWEKMPREGKDFARTQLDTPAKDNSGKSAEIFSFVFGETIQHCLQNRVPT